ncbi:MAG: HAMP domain-containing sensor histidine kinase [Anaerolineae bacterium]|nr:HAMP domain-containing sensor histidine kinase [Anaerolineae bacterium]
MSPSSRIAALIASLVPQPRYAYAVAGTDLRVQEADDPYALFAGVARPGCALSDLTPELEGHEAVLRSVLQGELADFDLQWVNRTRADGSLRYLSLFNRPLLDDADRVVGLFHLVLDVTEQGELQQRLMQQRNELRLAQAELAHKNLLLTAANIELRRLDEVRSQFVSAVAHELRTPLAAVIGYADVLLEELAGPMQPQQQAYVRTIQEAARRLLRITNDLLDAARLEAGKLELVLQPEELEPLVRSVVEELRPEWQAKGLEVAIRCPPDLPVALVDRFRMHQILANLVNNAVKYTPPGGRVVVSAAVYDDPDFLHLTVTDTGVGMSPEDQLQAFNLFYRARSAESARVAGTGVGLYIVRSLVELHGGRIWLQSTLGQGTSVHLTLPIAKGVEEEP